MTRVEYRVEVRTIHVVKALNGPLKGLEFGAKTGWDAVEKLRIAVRKVIPQTESIEIVEAKKSHDELDTNSEAR